MANREKHMRDLARDWIEGHDNTIPTRARSSRIIGSYTKNRRTTPGRRSPAILVEDELLEGEPLSVIGNAPVHVSMPRRHGRAVNRRSRRYPRESPREACRGPQGRQCGRYG